VRKVLALFVPVMVSLSLSQINLLLLPSSLARNFGLPRLLIFRAANRLCCFRWGYSPSPSTAAFPKLAQQAAGRTLAFQASWSKSIK